jgi:putative oxidoreductase
MKQGWFTETTRFLLIFLWTYTGVSKLLAYSAFVLQLRQHPWLSLAAPLLAFALPAVELLLAFLLLFSRTRGIALWGSLLFLVIFTLYLALMLLSGAHLPCSCGGVISSLSWQQHIALNLFFCLLTAVSIRNSTSNYKDRLRGRSQPVMHNHRVS